MKGRVVALGHLGGRGAAALIVDGRLDDFLIDPDSVDPPSPGSVFRVICARPLKGQGGMMVRLPDGTGFLRQGRGLRPGQCLLVQVSGYSEPGKAVPVTDRLLFKSRYVIVTPGAPGTNISRLIRDADARVRLLEIAADITGNDPNAGLILRSAAQHAANDDVAADIAAARGISDAVLAEPEGDPELLLDGPDAHALAWREWGTPDLLAEGRQAFSDHGVHALTQALASPRIALPNGAFAFVETTRALVAVDVNTGPDTSPAAGLKANISLARDLPRQLRCRGLGGQITIDFAPLAKKHRRQLEKVLKAGFAKDAVETALPGWTPLGHFELQRKRERLPVVVDWLE
ncbi:MAG: ribonuclease E/G [Paracoccaceae bacterium]